ncbi:MAG: hypothetical protein GXC72_00120 [Chitinophagaceae bacterium]|nr:hypothetical protein [Chitinophagaceae bacterium]
MHPNPQIAAELSEISPFWSDTPVFTPYHVPDGYFVHLPGLVADKRVLADTITGKNLPYLVPADYFAQLPAAVWQAIRSSAVSTELESVAPLLSGIPRQMPYSVPSGYFQEKPVTGITMPAAKPVPVRRMAARWMQYAAAAVVTGVLVMGAFMFTDGPGGIDNSSYIKMDVGEEMNKISEEDLSAYLSTHDKLLPGMDREAVSLDELPDASEHIQQVSDEDLEQYVNENTEPGTETTSPDSNETSL